MLIIGMRGASCAVSFCTGGSRAGDLRRVFDNSLRIWQNYAR